MQEEEEEHNKNKNNNSDRSSRHYKITVRLQRFHKRTDGRRTGTDTHAVNHNIPSGTRLAFIIAS